MATKAIERRIYRTEFRDVPGSKGRQKWATAVTYNTVDDYGTIWLPGCFDAALDTRMPTVLYGHDWYNLDHVLGAGIDKRQTPDDVGPPGVDVLVEFANVPAAELAMKLLDPAATTRGAVLRDVSVGFVREEWRTRNQLTEDEKALGDAEEAMIRSGMDELSIVVRGAVVGAQFRGRRIGGGVDMDAVVELAKRKAAGELTDAEAQAAFDLLAGPPEGEPGAGGGNDGGKGDPPAPEDFTALDAEADELLESLGRGGRR